MAWGSFDGQKHQLEFKDAEKKTPWNLFFGGGGEIKLYRVVAPSSLNYLHSSRHTINASWIFE